MSRDKYMEWEGDCWVRRGPRLVGSASIRERLDPFPRGLIPYTAKLNELWGPAAVDQALTQVLYGYLRFTEQLELKSINRVGQWIALGELPIEIPRHLRSRAFLLVRDEAHHATVSDDVAGQIERLTGYPPLVAGEPGFLADIAAVSNRSPGIHEADLETAFATISETLISGSLALIPKDESVLPLVRDYAEAHKVDEARHQAFFSEFFEWWWPRLPSRTRGELGPVLPDLCLAFLRPDIGFHQQVLEAVGLSPRQARDWVLESFPEASLGASVRRPLQVTLRVFQRAGVLDDSATADAFAARGLIDGSRDR